MKLFLLTVFCWVGKGGGAAVTVKKKKKAYDIHFSNINIPLRQQRLDRHNLKGFHPHFPELIFNLVGCEQQQKKINGLSFTSLAPRVYLRREREGDADEDEMRLMMTMMICRCGLR